MDAETKDAAAKCPACGRSVDSQKSFACRSCRKSPFCLDHLDMEYKICMGCAAEKRVTLYNNLLGQERGLRGFLRFTQFVFILAVFFFSFERFFHEYVPDFLKGSFFLEYVFYWGGAAVVCMGLCLIIIISQRQKIKEVEDKIQRHKADSRYTSR